MYSGRAVIKLKSLCWAILLLVLLFQDAISIYIETIKYYDEIIAILCFGYFLLEVLRTKISKLDMSIAVVVLIMCVVGFAGNAQSNVQNELKQQLFDAFNIFKYVLTIWGASRYFEKYRTKKYLIHYLAVVVKFAVVVSTFFMILNWCMDIGMHTDYRSGIRTYQFIFTRVGGLYSVCIIWLIILTAERYCNRPRFNGIFIILTLVNMCATLRSRAFAFAVLFVAFYFLFTIKIGKKQRGLYFMIIACVLLLVGLEQFEYYFAADSETARSILLQYGIITAQTYFPFGAGFGTYGTAVARDTYSVLYTQYGFHRYWGLAENGGFMTDNYWPAVMGEFGFLGTLLNVFLIALVCKKLLQSVDNHYSKICVLFALGTLLISSIASSAFFACTQLMFFTCLVCKLDFTEEDTIVRKNEDETANGLYPNV